jgi:GxxExxY protein
VNEDDKYPVRQLTGRILGAAIEVHRVIGPGLLESVYQTALAQELTIQFQREVSLALEYKGVRIENDYRLDFLVENQVVVELKSVKVMEPIFASQTLTYLKITGCRVGLLINFNEAKLMEGVQRFIR